MPSRRNFLKGVGAVAGGAAALQVLGGGFQISRPDAVRAGLTLPDIAAVSGVTLASFDRNDPADVTALANELANDPQNLGLAGTTNQQAADLLNTVGASGETIDVAVVDAATMQAAVVGSEYLNLPADARDLWQAMLTAGTTGQVQVKNQNIRNQVLAIWGAGTTTRSNLAALQSRSASRAEVLFGEGTVLNAGDIEEARL